jgi:hypothetical protein
MYVCDVSDYVHLENMRVLRFLAGVVNIHCKKRVAVFPSPAGMPLTILSLAGNNFNIPGQGEYSQ